MKQTKITKSAVCVLLWICCMLWGLSPVYAAQAPVVDNADLLTDSQQASLTAQINDIAARYQLEVVILTTKTLNGQPPENHVAPVEDGLIISVDMESREFYISTWGWAMSTFDEATLARLEDPFATRLSAGRYGDAFAELLKDVDNILRPEFPAEGWESQDPAVPLGKREGQTGPVFNSGLFLLLTAIGTGVSLLITVNMRRSMNTTHPKALAKEYVRSGSFHLTTRQDLYLYTTRTRVRVQSSSSSGGSHGGGHSSSHGGRGGHF